MIYLVEVEDAKGRKATKEYEVDSVRELGWTVETEIASYQELRVTGIWRKADSDRQLIRIFG